MTSSTSDNDAYIEELGRLLGLTLPPPPGGWNIPTQEGTSIFDRLAQAMDVLGAEAFCSGLAAELKARRRPPEPVYVRIGERLTPDNWLEYVDLIARTLGQRAAVDVQFGYISNTARARLTGLEPDDFCIWLRDHTKFLDERVCRAIGTWLPQATAERYINGIKAFYPLAARLVSRSFQQAR